LQSNALSAVIGVYPPATPCPRLIQSLLGRNHEKAFYCLRVIRSPGTLGAVVVTLGASMLVPVTAVGEWQGSKIGHGAPRELHGAKEATGRPGGAHGGARRIDAEGVALVVHPAAAQGANQLAPWKGDEGVRTLSAPR